MKMKHISKIIAIIGLLLVGMPKANAQVTVDAKIDSLQLLIGEQAKVTLEVSLDANQKLQLPMLRDTLVRGVEILDIAKPDTQMLNEGKRMLIEQEYTITSFDSALYYLPPFEVLVNDQPYRSKALGLKNENFETSNVHGYELKNPYRSTMEPFEEGYNYSMTLKVEI